MTTTRVSSGWEASMSIRFVIRNSLRGPVAGPRAHEARRPSAVTRAPEDRPAATATVGRRAGTGILGWVWGVIPRGVCHDAGFSQIRRGPDDDPPRRGLVSRPVAGWQQAPTKNRHDRRQTFGC